MWTGVDRGALWHGFADMGAIERDGAFVVARGEGAYIWDDAGTRYLDATAGLWFANIGHGRAEIGEAVAAQLAKVAHYSNFGDLALEPTVALADEVVAITAAITNTGARAGSEVVQLYVRDRHASVTRPLRQLAGFLRVDLHPGERKTVRFELAVSQLALLDRHYRLVVEPGAVASSV